MDNYFSKNLKYLRSAHHLTQEDIAKIVDKERSLIGHWESGNREATVEDVMKISDYFKIPMHQLIQTNLALDDEMSDNEESEWYKNLENQNVKIVFNKLHEKKNLTHEQAQYINKIIDAIADEEDEL